MCPGPGKGRFLYPFSVSRGGLCDPELPSPSFPGKKEGGTADSGQGMVTPSNPTVIHLEYSIRFQAPHRAQKRARLQRERRLVLHGCQAPLRSFFDVTFILCSSSQCPWSGIVRIGIIVRETLSVNRCKIISANDLLLNL